jgi:cell division protein FtsB
MTIIKPHRALRFRFVFEIALYILVALSILYGIWLYNAVVNITHEIDKQAKALDAARVKNAELKNKLFEQLDSQKLEALALERGLIRERSPKYFESDPRWLFASR